MKIEMTYAYLIVNMLMIIDLSEKGKKRGNRGGGEEQRGGGLQTNNTGMAVPLRCTQILLRFTAQNFAIPGNVVCNKL